MSKIAFFGSSMTYLTINLVSFEYICIGLSRCGCENADQKLASLCYMTGLDLDSITGSLIQCFSMSSYSGFASICSQVLDESFIVSRARSHARG